MTLAASARSDADEVLDRHSDIRQVSNFGDGTPEGGEEGASILIPPDLAPPAWPEPQPVGPGMRRVLQAEGSWVRFDGPHHPPLAAAAAKASRSPPVGIESPYEREPIPIPVGWPGSPFGDPVERPAQLGRVLGPADDEGWHK